MGNKLVLTGVTCNCGEVLAEQIANNFHKIHTKFLDGVFYIVRATSKSGYVEKLLGKENKRVGDITDAQFLKEIFVGADTVLHIAGIKYSKGIVEASVKNHVRRLILVHTTGIYSKYKSASKEYKEIEKNIYGICKKNHIKLTILRPTMIYGKINDKNMCVFIKMVDVLPIMPVVNQAKYGLQPVHYTDVGKACYNILVNETKTENRDFILSGKEAILLREIFIIIGEKLGKKVKFLNCPFPLAYMGAWIIWGFSFGKLDYREKVQRLCEPRVFSYKEAQKAFGYSPISFKEGISGEIKEYITKAKRYNLEKTE